MTLQDLKNEFYALPIRPNGTPRYTRSFKKSCIKYIQENQVKHSEIEKLFNLGSDGISRWKYTLRNELSKPSKNESNKKVENAKILLEESLETIEKLLEAIEKLLEAIEKLLEAIEKLQNYGFVIKGKLL